MAVFALARTLFVAALAVILTLPASLKAETLTDALISAYKHSNLLEQNRALLRAADEDVATAVAALRPIINYSLSSGISRPQIATARNVTTTAAIDLSLLLFDFGSSKLNTQVAKETVLATRHALISVEQQVLLNAVSAFMSFRSAVEAVGLAESNNRLIIQELRAAKDRFEVGETTRTDVALAESRLAASRANLAATQGQLAAAREAYKFAIGHYPGALAPPPGLPSTAMSAASARGVALKRHPNILELQHQVTVAEMNTERAKLAMRPTLSLSARSALSNNTTGYQDSASATLSLTGPIYRGGALSAGYRKAFAAAEATRASLHQTVAQISQNAANAWAELQVARAQVQATDQQIRAATVAFRGVREEANVGSRTTLDVLDAEQELLDARNAKLTAQTNEYIAAYALLAAMGLLTVEHLGLGITTYDPAVYYDKVKNAPVLSKQGAKLDRVLKSLQKK